MKDLFWVEIDLRAIQLNITEYKKLLGDNTAPLVVVKSNAYGHGMIEVAKAMEEISVSWLGVVNIEEALELREAGIRANILVLGYTPVSWYEKATEKNISLSMYNLDDAKAYTDDQQVSIHVKVDTGLCRMGFEFEKIDEVFKAVKGNNSLHVEGVWSHLADAENPASYHTKVQTDRFQKVIERAKNVFDHDVLFHIGASAAALMFPETRLDIERIGVAAYGMWPSEETKEVAESSDEKKLHTFSLKPALSYKTKLVQLKPLQQGALVGYGCSYRVRKDSTLGVVPVGYAEGLPRSLSNTGFMLLRGKKVPIVGTVCMNMTMIDISEVPDARLGDEVVIIGKQGEEVITVDDHAEWTDTINYEVTTRISKRVPRVFV